MKLHINAYIYICAHKRELKMKLQMKLHMYTTSIK